MSEPSTATYLKGDTMTLTVVTGDPMLTGTQVLAFPHNARGRTELGDLETALLRAHPAAFAGFSKQARQGRVTPGHYWLWREASPWLMFLVVRQSAVGATRLRHVQAVVMTLARDYHREMLKSLAVAPLGTPEECDEIISVMQTWFGRVELPVVAYRAYHPGVQADEGL